MNKTQKIAVIAIAALMAFMPTAAFAATASNVVTASASVGSALSLQTTIIQHEGTPDVQTTVGSMSFGSLSPTGFGGLASPRFFTVYVSANTQSAAYILSQNGQDMSNGTTTLPDGAQNMVLVYNAADNGNQGIPVGATLGTPVDSTWIGARTIYDSENTNAQIRAIQCIYGLRSDAALGTGNFVPANQAPGTYQGNITFTVTV